MPVMITDFEAFIVGVQVGRRLKVADAMRELPPKPPVPPQWRIVTETGSPIISETGDTLITEEWEIPNA